MPLPSVAGFGAKQCTAKAKHSGCRCKNPAAYGMRVCRMHGARKKGTILSGTDHPNFQHGRETREARTQRTRALARLAELEEQARSMKLIAAPRSRGRKPIGTPKTRE